MKKIITFFSVFVLILGVLNAFSLATSTPRVYLEDAIKYDNEQNVTISIYMENTDSNIVALGLDLKYDTSKLEYVSSKAGKDLNATLKIDENIPDESRVAIAIMSITGLKNDGLYYQITFKVKDSSSDIPLELSLREASDSNGNDIKVETYGGKIKISSQEVVQEEKTVTQTIETFEVTDVETLATIEDILVESASIEVEADDLISYEVEENNVVEILNDGTIIPNQDGTAIVKVKMNGQDIGTVEVTVKDGVVEKVTGSSNGSSNNLELGSTATESSSNDSNTSSNIESQEESSSKLPVIILVIIILVFIIILIIKKSRRKK